MKDLITSLVAVKLSVSEWTGRHRNRTLEVEAESAHNAKDAVSVWQRQLGEAYRKPISTAVSRLRDHFYSRTLPWEDGGWRVVPVKEYLPVVDGFGKLFDEFNAAVEHLCNNWDAAYADAQQRLNGLFDPSKFPDRFEIREKYHASINQRPLLNADDARIVGLDEAVQNKIRRDLAEQYAAQIDGTVADLTQRIREVLEDASERLATTPEKGARFAGLIRKAGRVADEVRRLNITDDPGLALAAESLGEVFNGLDPESLKDDALRVKALAVVKGALPLVNPELVATPAPVVPAPTVPTTLQSALDAL